MYTFFPANRHADDRGIANAADTIQHPLDVFGKDVQPLGRDDHFLLAPADEQRAVGPDFADVTRVEPAVLEGPRGFLGGMKVAGRDVLAAHQDFAVRRDLHIDAGDHFPHRPFLSAERMIQGDDRRGFGQAVPLHDHEPQLGPEGFKGAVERRGADDKRPEFQAEQPMNRAEMPPPARPVPLRAGARRLGRNAKHVLAQDVEDLRHADDHRNPPAAHLGDDVDGVVAAHEHDDALQHRRDERGHGLAEHVAERQQVEKPQREEGTAPLAILQHLALDRHDVRQHVAMRDHHTLGLGRRARREDDLGHVVARDGDRGEGRRLGHRPLELVKCPDRRAGNRAKRRHILPDEDEPGRHDPAHAHEKVRRRAIVDRDHDDAAEEAPPERRDPLGAVLAPEDDGVALAEAGSMEARREFPRHAADVFVRVRADSEAVVVHKKVAANGREVLEKVDERVARHE